MSYTKLNLSDGDVLTAEHMAHIEQGIADACASAPVRGEDYWTEEDKAEIKSYVDEAILGGAW